MQQTRMTENRRQSYLALMGVEQWYSRIPLPGAAQSPRFRTESAANQPGVDAGADLRLTRHLRRPSAPLVSPLVAKTRDVAAVTPDKPVGRLLGAPKAKNVDIQALKESHGLEQSSSESGATASGLLAEVSGPDSSLMLRWYATESYFAVSSWSALHSPENEIRLLEGIGYALEGKSTNFFYCGEFCWPAFDQAVLIENGPEMKQKLLQRWFTDMLDQNDSGGEGRLLMFGDPEDETLNNVISHCFKKTGCFKTGGFKTGCIRMKDSLSDMLVDPALKLRVWQQIRAMSSR